MPVPKSIPKVKPPLHQPRTWKQNNRLLRPGLPPAGREDYRERIITPKVEPAWSRAVGFINMFVCAAAGSYILFFVDFGAKDHVFQNLRSKVDNWWAEYWYITSSDRRRLNEQRMKQDEKIREQERLLDEKIAASRAAGGGAQPA